MSVEGTFDAAWIEENQRRAVGGKLAILVLGSPLVHGLARSYVTIAESDKNEVLGTDPLDRSIPWRGFNSSEALEIITLLERIEQQDDNNKIASKST